MGHKGHTEGPWQLCSEEGEAGGPGAGPEAPGSVRDALRTENPGVKELPSWRRALLTPKKSAVARAARDQGDAESASFSTLDSASPSVFSLALASWVGPLRKLQLLAPLRFDSLVQQEDTWEVTLSRQRTWVSDLKCRVNIFE